MGFWVGRQLVVARLRSGGLWIHSPIPWTPALRTEVAALGPVRHVIGPNCQHDECLREFQAEYPDAAFHAAAGLAERRPDLHLAHTLSDRPHADWADTFDQHVVRGAPSFNETVFLHRPSRSLIIADLALNLGPECHWLLALVLRLDGAYGRFTPTRAAKALMKDRTAVRHSIDHILAWDFERIIVGHGRNIETDAKQKLREAFAFL